MADRFTFHFSHTFSGIIWNMLADARKERLYLEVRNPEEKKVTFSALNLQNNQWLWKDINFDEPWWISLGAVEGDVLLLTIYTDTNNPDKKSLIAYDVPLAQIIWWHNGFSVSAVNGQFVMGIDAKFPGKEVALDLFTGKPLPQADFDLADSQNFTVIRPFQYEEGTDHFETVKQFLAQRLGISPVARIEYLEVDTLIILSVFVKGQDLANYLYAFSTNGELLFEETLGENLKGVGLDTFFVFSGQLIFVKNKNELKSYKIL